MMRVSVRPQSCILSQTSITTSGSFKYMHNDTNVRAVHPCPTRNPFHTFNKRRSTQSRHRQCSVFGQHMMRVRLRPHTASNNNITTSNSCKHTAIQTTYALFVQGQHDTRSIDSTNAGQCKAVINIIVVYSKRKMAYEVKLHTRSLMLLHQTSITTSSNVNRTRSNS